MQRADMRHVADITREKGEPACRVNGFEDNFRAWSELVIRGLEKPHQVVGLEMFHDLCGYEPAERAVRKGFEVRQAITHRRIKAALAADGDHLVVGIHTACG